MEGTEPWWSKSVSSFLEFNPLCYSASKESTWYAKLKEKKYLHSSAQKSTVNFVCVRFHISFHRDIWKVRVCGWLKISKVEIWLNLKVWFTSIKSITDEQNTNTMGVSLNLVNTDSPCATLKFTPSNSFCCFVLPTFYLVLGWIFIL